ncbi:MAG: TRAM domain-containing protein [Candidatus Micrarchaeota archaeon]
MRPGILKPAPDFAGITEKNINRAFLIYPRRKESLTVLYGYAAFADGRTFQCYFLRSGDENMAFGRGGRGGFGGGFGGDSGPKPVKVGDELDVTIEAIASKGDGIAKIEGFVIFVPNAKEGEKIRIRVTDVKRSCAVAEKVG